MHSNILDYILPNELILKTPPIIRGNTRLLVYKTQTNEIIDDFYMNLDNYLDSTDLVILNNTKVIPARIIASDGVKDIEILILEKHDGNQPFKVISNKKLKVGSILNIGGEKIRVIDKIDSFYIIDITNDQIMKFGTAPIPPYFKRLGDDQDMVRYQTEFAKVAGSVAAPTASLNFTNDLIRKLKDKRIDIEEVTLHCGYGTFNPIKTDLLTEHKMHSEYYEVKKSILDSTKNILAVGTTVVRSIESASRSEIIDNDGVIKGEANIFLYPGIQFNKVSKLLTNFHAPKSTPLFLLAAFLSYKLNNVDLGVAQTKRIYEHAINKKYNFLSYGDSMLVI